MNYIDTQNKLKKDVSFPLLIFYGLGTIVGAGIYVLVGRIAGIAGGYAPYAFMLAFSIAFITALSYGELTKKFPFSGGGSLYVLEATNSDILSRIIGILIIITTISSAATMSIGFAEYLQTYVNIHQFIIIFSMISLLGYVAFLGIKESAILIAIITVIEITGLIYVIYIGKDLISIDNIFALNVEQDFSIKTILAASLIAFYAFIGFEDMANISEEVKNSRKVVKPAIILVMLIVAIMYILIATIISNIELDSFQAPMQSIILNKGYDPIYITVIGMLATLNGVIVHLILVSRVLYGMSNKGNAPKIFSKLHKKNKTPYMAILFVVFAVIALTSFIEIVSLAKISSYVILTIFLCVNVSLVIIEIKNKEERNIVNGLLLPSVAAMLISVFLFLNFVS